MPKSKKPDRLETLRAHLRDELPPHGFEIVSQGREFEQWQRSRDELTVTALARAGGRPDLWSASLDFVWVTRAEWGALADVGAWPPAPTIDYWNYRGLRDRFVTAKIWHGPPEFAIEPNLSDDEEEHWRIALPRAIEKLCTQLAGLDATTEEA